MVVLRTNLGSVGNAWVMLHFRDTWRRGVEENEARETAKATEDDQPEDWG